MEHIEHLEMLKVITNAEATLEAARLEEKAFSRNRRMPFASALSFLLDMRKTTLQTRLNQYFGHTKGGNPISQQAFSKLRMNFDHSPFETMVREVVKKEYSGQYELPVWNGFHVFGVDGSYLQLPRVDALRQEFGVRGGGTQPSAGISVLYDVLHGWVLDPIITHTDMNERSECERHIRYLGEQLPNIAANSVITLDRGYASLDLFAKLQESGLKFVARCSSACVAEINTAPLGDSTVALKNGVCVRVIKFKLENGDVEMLATNLFELPEESFPELYSLRWGVETAYFRLKQELSIEKFSGKTPNSIRQDFWASMVLINSVAIFQQDANEAVRERQKDKPVKHVNRARTSDLIVTLRDRFIFAALCAIPMFSETEMDDVIRTMARAVSPVRSNRHYNRLFRPNNAANHNLKSRL
jgi:hypothetical protein